MARAKQYAERVNIIKMVKVNGKWRFARIVERNGRIIRDHVWVDGRDEHHPEGRYYLEWYEDGKRRRKPVESYDLRTAAGQRLIRLKPVPSTTYTHSRRSRHAPVCRPHSFDQSPPGASPGVHLARARQELSADVRGHFAGHRLYKHAKNRQGDCGRKTCRCVNSNSPIQTTS